MEQRRPEQREELEIDLLELAGVIWDRLGIVVLSGVIAALAFFLVSMYLIVPEYESSTKLYVINRQNSDQLTYSDLQSGSQLTKDYKEMVTSRPVLEEVISELNMALDSDELAEKIVVETPPDTRIITITVEDQDPYTAREIADSVRNAAAKHIGNVMDIEAVNIVEEANLPIAPSSPNMLLNTLLGGVLGLLISMGSVILIYILDDTVKTPDDVEEYLGLSVLASIPLAEDRQKSKKKKKKRKQKDGQVIERFGLIQGIEDLEDLEDFGEIKAGKGKEEHA